MEQTNQNKSLTDILTNTKTNVNPIERIVSATAGGAVLAYGLKRGGVFGTALSVLGGAVALRGVTGHCQVYDAVGIDTSDKTATNKKSGNKRGATYGNGMLSGKVHVTKAVTINKSPAELYSFWHNFENLPKFMEHLESVKNTGDKRSHWIAKAPLGTTVEWDAEVTSDQENVRIGWRSLEGADIPNSGVVEFLPTTDRGTEVKVVMTYEAPGGKLGALFAKLFGEEPGQQVYGDLYRFKSLMESGEVITTEGQTSGRAPEAKRRPRRG